MEDVWPSLALTFGVMLALYLMIKGVVHLIDFVDSLSIPDRREWRKKWEFRFVVAAAFVVIFCLIMMAMEKIV